MNFEVEKYHEILCPEFPEFLKKYLSLPLLTRLKGIGLLCGTDYTALYSNRFFYSRYDHSVGCALIAWNFTRDKKQCIASLLHDVSTPVFSHVGDFRKGDALKQEATEDINVKLIMEDKELHRLLQMDGLQPEDVCDYHVYPVCDNEIPQLSSDRLEYMFPSGMALCDHVVKDSPCFDIESTERCYKNIRLLKNENGNDELGFTDEKIAVEYTKRFCDVALILQRNENKLALNMLGEIVNEALRENVLKETDLYSLSEKLVIEIFDEYAESAGNRLGKMIRKWRLMKEILHVEYDPCQRMEGDYYAVSLNVKKRYINPLVLCSDGAARRIADVNEEAKKIIDSFLLYKDTRFGAVKL